MTDAAPSGRLGGVVLFTAIAAGVLFVDLYSKRLADRLPTGNAVHLLGSPFMLLRAPHPNAGALYGWGRNWGDRSNQILLVIGVGAVLGISHWVFLQPGAKDRIILTSLSLVTGGTLGNLHDRAVFGGVRDFLSVDLHFAAFPVFNLADCALVVGASLLLVEAFACTETGNRDRDVAQSPAHRREGAVASASRENY